ncbi:MAG: YggT family protein [Pseudomonadota bacterium]
MRAILDIVLMVINLAVWVIIIQAVLSWLVAFNVLNTRNQFVNQIWRTLQQLTEPLIGPVRRRMPMNTGLDLSPLVVIFGLYFLQRVIIYYIYPNVI